MQLHTFIILYTIGYSAIPNAAIPNASTGLYCQSPVILPFSPGKHLNQPPKSYLKSSFFPVRQDFTVSFYTYC